MPTWQLPASRTGANCVTSVSVLPRSWSWWLCPRSVAFCLALCLRYRLFAHGPHPTSRGRFARIVVAALFGSLQQRQRRLRRARDERKQRHRGAIVALMIAPR